VTSKCFKITLRTLALFGAAAGSVILFLSVRGPSAFPQREILAPVTGPIAWASPDRYSIRFGIAGDSRTFAYAHKSGERATVAAALANASEQPITILVNPREPREGVAGGEFFQVYELRAGQALLRSYAQVKDAWASDYWFGFAAALLAFFAAGLLEYAARRVPPNNSFKPKPLRGSA
jgi:hypothetical protein